MGLFDTIMGNASEIPVSSLKEEFDPILCDGEELVAAFVVIRDKWIFTNKRLILLNIQGLTGKKRDYHSIPYKSITQFSVETAGTLDDDSEISIWVKGMSGPLKKELSRKVDVKRLQKILANFILNE